MKFVNTHLRGTYVDRDGKSYRVESMNTSSKDIINFYLLRDGKDDLLMCSIYTMYLSKATGVKKAGEIVREVYGDFKIFAEYEDFKNRAMNIGKDKVPNSKRMKLFSEDFKAFVDVIEKRGDSFYHKLEYMDGSLVTEIIQDGLNVGEDRGSVESLLGSEVESSNVLNESLSLNLVERGKAVKVAKLKGIEYVSRDAERVSKSSSVVQIQSLDYIALKKDISWMKTRDYRIVNTEEDLLAYLVEMDAINDVVGFDTETSGLRINRFPMNHPKRDNLVGICLSIRENEGIYIPIRQTKFNNLDEAFVIKTLEPYLSKHKDKSKNKKLKSVVTHYGSFDWKVMYTYGWDLNITDDTYILQYLIDVREANAVKKLKVMSEKILGLQMIDLEDFFPATRGGKRSNIQFSLLPYESVRHYGPTDADITRALYFELRPLLPTDMKFIYSVEVDLLKRLGKVEYYGIKIDIAKMIEEKEKVTIEKEILEKEIYEMAGEVFNINSGDQLERILFDKLKYPSHGLTKSGKRATGKDVLEMLSKDRDKEGNVMYPLADMIFKYKKKEKLLSAFLDKLLRENVEGFIFPKYNQAGTQSGRISGNNPNLQQTSGAIREMFVPDSDDYYFLVVDYSQVEYRIMAGLGNQYDLVEYFRENPEADFHILMYAQMYNKRYEDVTSKERKTGKTLNFGISYGMSPASLAIKLFGSNTKEQTADAEKKIKEYFDSVSNIRDYMTATKDLAQARGFVRTLFNRRRYIPEFLKENPKYYEIERGKRKAGNTVVQGTAADIMKIAHTAVEDSLDKAGIDVRVVASIHDELVIQVNKKYNHWYMINLVRKAMELNLSKFNFPPLYIGANVGKSWGDGKKDHLEAPVLLMERMCEQVDAGMHTEPIPNNIEVFEQELKMFALEQLKVEIDKMNHAYENGLEGNNFPVKTVEDAWNIQRLAKFAGSYLGDDANFAIRGILSGDTLDSIFANLSKVEILGDDFYELIEEDSLDSFTEDEDAAIIDYDRMQNYYEANKDKLKLESPTILTAASVYNEGYSVVGYDRKMIVRIDEPNREMLGALINYFEENNVEKGIEVHMVIRGKYKTLPYNILRIDRLAIINIIEEHMTVKAD